MPGFLVLAKVSGDPRYPRTRTHLYHHRHPGHAGLPVRVSTEPAGTEQHLEDVTPTDGERAAERDTWPWLS